MPEWRDMNDVLREADDEATEAEAARVAQLERGRGRIALTCPACGIQHADPADLRAHFLAEHEEAGEFVCPDPDCREVFESKNALNGHKSKHRPKYEPPAVQAEPSTIVCLVPGCDFESEVKLDVQRHVAETHPKCEPCGSRFFDAAALADHQAVCVPYRESQRPLKPEPEWERFERPRPGRKKEPSVAIFGPGFSPVPEPKPEPKPDPAWGFRVDGTVSLGSECVAVEVNASGQPLIEFVQLLDAVSTWESNWRTTP